MTDSSQQRGRSFRHRFEGPFFRRLLIGGIKSIPLPVQRASMPLWASIFFALVPPARRAAEQNLARILYRRDLSALGFAERAVVLGRAYKLFENYAQTLAYLYGLHLGQPSPVEVDFVGLDNVHRVVAAGRGVVTVTGHLGPWQLTPFIIQDRGSVPPMTMAMAEEPNANVSEWEARFREKFKIVYTTRSPFALLGLAKVLANREIVGMQLDRHPGGAHVVVDFFGRPARFPLGPAVLARTSGCPIIPLFASYPAGDRRRVEVRYEAPIEVPRTRDKKQDYQRAMEQVVAIYERYVEANPDQWFNFYDFWRSDSEVGES